LETRCTTAVVLGATYCLVRIGYRSHGWASSSYGQPGSGHQWTPRESGRERGRRGSINLYLWADPHAQPPVAVLNLDRSVTTGERLIFDLDEVDWARWGQRLTKAPGGTAAGDRRRMEPAEPRPADARGRIQHLRVIDCRAAWVSLQPPR
jgi:hypothetical protein